MTDRPLLPPRGVRPIEEDPQISVPPDVLARHNAVVLDPTTAARVAGQRPIHSTVYIADKLIVSGGADAETMASLAAAAEQNGLVLAPETREARRAKLTDVACSVEHPDAVTLFPRVIELVAAPGQATVPDAWTVLQTFRANLGDNVAAQRHVGLDHLLTAARHVFGSPYTPADDVATSSYGRPGSGGRMPVAWSGRKPHRDPNFDGRRPVVAVLDTGCGYHDWFPDVVTHNATFEGVPLGLTDPGDNPEVTGVIYDPLEGELDSDAGHGTFIAGLIRQTCPEADILAIRVMASDGAVVEHVLIESLTLLALRQHAAQNADDPSCIVDVVSLSLGYYHEQSDSPAVDFPVLAPLNALAGMGVAVVAAAGNDATSRAMFPAAFFPHAGGEVTGFDASVVPVLSVGARNPDGTVALFSNAGNWVTCHRPGANLVSTFPPFDGSQQAPISFPIRGGIRASIDPDDYTGGFGVWSGTSFAAPLLAGELAQALIDGGSLGDLGAASCVSRGWAAITETTQIAVT